MFCIIIISIGRDPRYRKTKTGRQSFILDKKETIWTELGSDPLKKSNSLCMPFRWLLALMDVLKSKNSNDKFTQARHAHTLLTKKSSLTEGVVCMTALY